MKNIKSMIKLKTIEELLVEKHPTSSWSGKSFEEYSGAFYERLEKEIPPRFRGAEIVDDGLKKFSQTFDGTKGLYLFGDCGVGKTRNLYAIYKLFKANEILNVTKGENTILRHSIMKRIILPVRFTNITDFFSDLKQTFDDSDSEGIIQAKIKSNIILFIDDFGAEKTTEWTIEATYRLINYRYEWIIPTFFSSNLSLQELSKNIGDRFSSRIAEMCEVLKLEGNDRRIK